MPFNLEVLCKKTWAFIRVPYMNPTISGLSAQGFLIRFLHYLFPRADHSREAVATARTPETWTQQKTNTPRIIVPVSYALSKVRVGGDGGGGGGGCGKDNSDGNQAIQLFYECYRYCSCSIETARSHCARPFQSSSARPWRMLLHDPATSDHHQHYSAQHHEA